jgi:PAS domain S-box-containing protein
MAESAGSVTDVARAPLHAPLRVRAALYGVLVLVMLAASGLPLDGRLGVAALAGGAAIVPWVWQWSQRLTLTEVSATADVIAGWLVFLVMPTVPAISVLMALMGLLLSITARPMVQRIVLGLAVIAEVVKLPKLFSGDVVVSVPAVSDLLESPFDVLVGAAAQAGLIFGAYAVARFLLEKAATQREAMTAGVARYRGLAEELPVAVLVVSQSKVIFANPAAQRLLGDGSLPIDGQFLYELLPDELVAGVRDAMGTLVPGGDPVHVEARPGGSAETPGYLAATVTTSEYDGEPATIIVVNDLSRRVAVEEANRNAEARFRAAFTKTATPFLLVDVVGEIDQTNGAARSLFADVVGGLLGRPLTDLIHDPTGSLTGFLGDGSWESSDHCRAEVMTRVGGRAVADVTLVRDREGDPDHFVVQLHDVTDRHRAEAALRESEERYRELFARHPVPQYRIRPEGEVVEANAALVALLGHADADALAGHDLTAAYVDAQDRDRIRRRLERDGHVVDYESELIRNDGSRIWVRDTARIVSVGGESMIEGALLDVTDRRRIEDELRSSASRGETVATLGQRALESIDLEAVFAETVRTVGDVLGLARVGIFAATDGAKFHRVDGEAWPEASVVVSEDRMQALAGYAAASPRPVVIRAVDGDESEADHAGTAVGVAIGGAESIFGVLIGIDDGRRIFSEDDLRFLRSVVNVLVAAVVRDDAHRQLEELLLSKDQFIASVSHELRTPLTVVAGVTHELHEGWRDMSDDALDELISLAVEQSRDMHELIEDLLVAARADIGRVSVHMAQMDLAPVAESVYQALTPREAEGVTLELEEAATMGDAVRVRQVVRNLLTNAFRYGGPNVRIVSGTAAGCAFVRVVDNGAGIDPALRESVFEAYESAHEQPGRTGSVGLGLTVSRKLARLMGGDLTYRFEDGSVFELALPATRAASQDHTDSPMSWSAPRT